MITKETAAKILSAHIEIENANKILIDMAEIVARDKEKGTPTLYNAFGERKGLQLGVPTGESSHRLFDVNSALAVKIVEQHIVDKMARLEELMTIARLELNHKL